MPYRIVHHETREARAFDDAHRTAYWLADQDAALDRRSLPAFIEDQGLTLEASGSAPLIVGGWEIYEHGDPAWSMGLQPRTNGTAHDGVQVYDTDDGHPAR
ncbi:hypothetical protein [Amycolatopsis sp. H20-H5]|uniref:hypothetical protein n=1 Tax=Amycolatopsis sp. H20-H5 TaxID=3046309 RepID=UPI002DB8F8B3|nr:hypothetical protein [Amycolatopsis sp. H20-H5]MEC3977916.1 hypothetical protein [Amycolatopsis sp. H20-H5]